MLLKKATGMSLAKLREAVEDRGAWRALVHGVTKSRTRLNNRTTTKQNTKYEGDDVTSQCFLHPLFRVHRAAMGLPH